MRTLLVGAGHLARRILALLDAEGADVVFVTRDQFRAAASGEPTFDSIVAGLRALGTADIAAAYLVDDRDELNLEFLIALLSIDSRLPVVLSLFNENQYFFGICHG